MLTFEIIFWTLLSALVLLGCIGGISQAIRPDNPEKRINYILGTLIGLAILFFLVRQIFVVYSLTNNFAFATGITTGDCDAGKQGRGIQFEYSYFGTKYTNCANRPGNIEVRTIGGEYKVRVPKAFPQNGRIEFDQPVANK